MDIEKCKSIIKKTFPFLQIWDFKINNEGMDNLILFVNKNLVFRFPKANNFFDREVRFLKEIVPNITADVPVMNIYKTDGVEFSVHRFIRGQIYNNLTDEQKTKFFDNISTDLAIFFAELHSIKTKQKPEPEHEGRNIKNKDIILSFLKTEVQKASFEKCLQDAEMFAEKYANKDLVICHNDLHGNNFTIDEATGHLSGVIDYGDVSVRNYTTDFFMLFEDGEKLGMETLKKYEKMTGNKVDILYLRNMQKYRAYRKIGSCIEKGEDIKQCFIDKINDIF
ncbi:MAG: hypothetical protein Ta2D_00520 [Rickettsiales bacterium]|nr:MAG: hypothetical protein Ta2D_00520 [Rickettsiales bacterium]